MQLAKKGMKVALVERSARMYGGTCINTGCIPTKYLANKASMAGRERHWGESIRENFYWDSIREKDGLVAKLNYGNYKILEDQADLDLITGHASFVSSNEVSVALADGSSTMLTAERIFINTGAREHVPDIPGADLPNVFTSTTIMDLGTLPKTLCVLGGGFIGLEFASIYAQFGSRVTVLETGNELLSGHDRDVARSVMARLEKIGISFVFNASVREIRPSESGSSVLFDTTEDGTEGQVMSEAVLLATGRRPNTEGLDVQRAGIALSSRGAVLTDFLLRTSVPNIWALGDVRGEEQFTYASMDDSRIILDQVYGGSKRTTGSRMPLPYSVFIDPPFSHVGMSEHEALKKGINIAVSSMRASEIPQAMILGQTDGFLKLMVGTLDGKILGCTLFCTGSHEIINLVRSAMKLKEGYAYLRDSVFTHPTMSEALNELCSRITLDR